MKEKIICITTPSERTYYQATVLAKEFLDKERNVVNTTGTLPDGEVEEYNATSQTNKTLLEGKLHGDFEIINLATGAVTLREKYNHGTLVTITPNRLQANAVPPTETVSPVPIVSGTIVKTNKGTHSFYVNGQEVAEETLSSAGTTIELLGTIPDGEVKELDENNKIKAIAYYRNNKLNGTLTRYDEDGEVLCREEYINGMLQGPAEYFSYSKDNLLYAKCTYKNALLEGERTVSQKDGTLREKATYSQGKLQGERTCFYGNGAPELTESYKDGKLHGERTLFFPSGEMWFKENFSDGLLDGKRIGYYPWGQVYLEEFYREGVLNGPRRIYGQNGDLLTQEDYHRGTLQHSEPSNA